MTDETRMNKARERQRRRQQKRQAMVEATSAVSRGRQRQVRPADVMDWANVPHLKAGLAVVAGLLFMGGIVWAVGLFKDDPVIPDANALWIGADWTYNTHNDDTMQTFIRQLDTNHVGTVYARVSELNYDGTWTGRADGINTFAEVETTVTGFVEQFQRLAPHKQIYGTVYFRVDIGQTDNYRLNNPNIQELVADFAADVVNVMGFDGVLLVVEPVWNANSGDFLDLLRMVRRSIGDDARLAVAVPPDWTPEDDSVPQTALITPGTVWDQSFKQRVALVGVDEIVVQAYNSYLNRADDYAEWMAHQVEQYATAIGELGISTRVLIGLPAYESILPAHDDRIENIPNGIDGIQRGLARTPDFAEIVQGVALYAEWDMESTHWDQFRTGWANLRR